MQSSIGGAIDYSDQSCYDILKDIQHWIEETRKLDDYMNNHLKMTKK